MKRFNQPVTYPREQGSPLKYEIFWCSEDGGRTVFPNDINCIKERRYSLNSVPLNSFSSAVNKAVERIWIVDEYFLMPSGNQNLSDHISTILNWLHNGLLASDIRILTGEHKEINNQIIDKFQKKAREINVLQPKRQKKCRIQINTHLNKNFDYIHDRFAIVDSELWHFGATVGGFHNKVSAASRGWDAVDTGAIGFFEKIWEKCEGN